MRTVYIRPDAVIGYHVETEAEDYWFVSEAQALAWAWESLPECAVYTCGPDGEPKAQHEPTAEQGVLVHGSDSADDAWGDAR